MCVKKLSQVDAVTLEQNQLQHYYLALSQPIIGFSDFDRMLREQ